ncbi:MULTISPECIES: ROK family glucokinase [unclassified Staphylococcus]|uniref:ROK family glucokinase n=1 Tax=unclassified Staphylococcus TaxID=91994 RepID=UPI0021CEE7E3|nr:MULTISPECIES: ROK family glucokinase [unclassified Staphylococcus]UXR79320.1 ROK family glucokinase [Staphylococcus sp. IVB6227]UXR81571.1 ROK family glucokinase [Staphylococcus sp. IVB6214]
MKHKIILSADIGGTTCKLGIFDQNLHCIEKWAIHTDTTDQSGFMLLKQIHDAFVEKVTMLDYQIEHVIGIGIGVPGPVDFESGVVRGAVNLNWPESVPVAKIMTDLLGRPVIVDNDANVAALGEMHKGAGQSHSDIAMITLGTGVGGGIVSNGKIVHGHNGSGAEIGHIRVDHDQRFKCNCGKSGCIETVASATGVVNLAHYYHPQLSDQSQLLPLINNKSVSAKDVFDAAKSGDLFSLHIVEKVSQYIAYLASILSVTANPKYIIIGGGMSEAGHILIENIKTAYQQIAFTPAQEGTEILQAQLGNDAGIVGAAGLIKTYILEKE